MNKWQASFLGLKQLPRELSGFEIEAFFYVYRSRTGAD